MKTACHSSHDAIARCGVAAPERRSNHSIRLQPDGAGDESSQHHQLHEWKSSSLRSFELSDKARRHRQRAASAPKMLGVGHSRSIYSCGNRGLQMMGVFAEFERAMIQERVRAGLARARGEGKRLGRPPIAPALEKRIREALATPGRPGIRVIAERFGVNPSTVQRISRPFADNEAPAGDPHNLQAIGC